MGKYLKTLTHFWTPSQSRVASGEPAWLADLTCGHESLSMLSRQSRIASREWRAPGRAASRDSPLRAKSRVTTDGSLWSSLWLVFQVIPLYSAPDNIQVEPETGHLWIASHSVVWRLMQHLDDRDKLAPAQVRVLIFGASYPKIYEKG